jgi:hypothetical protein
VPDTGPMTPGQPASLAELVARRTLDAELGALVWLLVEGGAPVVVVGPAPLAVRAELASAVVSVDSRLPAVVLDADAEAPTLSRLTALIQGGTGVALVLAARDLEASLERLHDGPAGLPYDAIRRLGVVLVMDVPAPGPRVTVAHYLRPTERDGQGHVQRRAPAVLAAWDEAHDAWEHFAWGVTPELADRIDRSQADVEQRQLDRAGFLTAMARGGATSVEEWRMVVSRYLATEATRTPSTRPGVIPPPGSA